MVSVNPFFRGWSTVKSRFTPNHAKAVNTGISFGLLCSSILSVYLLYLLCHFHSCKCSFLFVEYMETVGCRLWRFGHWTVRTLLRFCFGITLRFYLTLNCEKIYDLQITNFFIKANMYMCSISLLLVFKVLSLLKHPCLWIFYR